MEIFGGKKGKNSASPYPGNSNPSAGGGIMDASPYLADPGPSRVLPSIPNIMGASSNWVGTSRVSSSSRAHPVNIPPNIAGASAVDDDGAYGSAQPKPLPPVKGGP